MKKRIMWTEFLITAIALIVFSLISAEVYYRSSLAYSEEYLRVYVNLFDEEKTEQELTKEYADRLSSLMNGARVTFLTAEGAYIADSLDGNGASRADRPEVVAAAEKGEGFDVRSSATVGENLVYYCKNFGAYFVRIAIPTSSMWGVYLRSLPTVAAFLAGDACLCLLLTYLTTGYMLRPMENLAREAARKKHVETDCPELKEIARLMNGMNDDVAARMKEVDEEKDLVVRAQQSKNEFIANITHEMNTPLTSIKGFAELLSTGALEGEKGRKAAETILTQSERLTNLVASIINYNEIDNENLPEYEVNASNIARETLETLAPAISARKLVLLTDIEENVLLVSRHERVTEIFGNLIRNAIRYNREGGSISVLLDKREFVVSDTGIGIAEENIDRIFDRFFTVDKSHSGKNGGFGLGLSVVRKLCNKAGWDLSVRSELGKGTTFRIGFVRQDVSEPQID